MHPVCREGTNAASFNEISKKEARNEEDTSFNVWNADGGSFFGNCAANVRPWRSRRGALRGAWPEKIPRPEPQGGGGRVSLPAGYGLPIFSDTGPAHAPFRVAP